jgi:hypothetical protein
VDGCLPPPTIGFSDAEPSVFAPALIEKVDMPVRERSPNQTRKHINDAAELVLHSGPFVTFVVRMRHSTGERDHTLVSVRGEEQAIRLLKEWRRAGDGSANAGRHADRSQSIGDTIVQ